MHNESRPTEAATRLAKEHTYETDVPDLSAVSLMDVSWVAGESTLASEMARRDGEGRTTGTKRCRRRRAKVEGMHRCIYVYIYI